MASRRPWHLTCCWSVEAVATRDALQGHFKKGDWIEIYCDSTKKQAVENAGRWSAEHHTPTRVVPGPGHKTRRGF